MIAEVELGPESLCLWGFPSGSVGKESACNARDMGDVGLIPELGISPGGGNGDSLQYSCLENSMDGGAWRDIVHGVAKSQIRLNTWHIIGFESFCLSLHTWPQDLPPFLWLGVRAILSITLWKAPLYQGTGLDAFFPTSSCHLDVSRKLSNFSYRSYKPVVLKVEPWSCNMDNAKETKWSVWAGDSEWPFPPRVLWFQTLGEMGCRHLGGPNARVLVWFTPVALEANTMLGSLGHVCASVTATSTETPALLGPQIILESFLEYCLTQVLEKGHEVISFCFIPKDNAAAIYLYDIPTGYRHPWGRKELAISEWLRTCIPLP